MKIEQTKKNSVPRRFQRQHTELSWKGCLRCAEQLLIDVREGITHGLTA